MVSNITCGEQWTKMVKSLMCISRIGEMAQPLSASSGDAQSGGEPRKIVTDKQRSYPVANWKVMPETIHSTKQYENNRAEQSHQSTRVRKRGMRRFKSMGEAQRFVTVHSAVANLSNFGRRLMRSKHYRDLRISAFGEWRRAVA